MASNYKQMADRVIEMQPTNPMFDASPLITQNYQPRHTTEKEGCCFDFRTMLLTAFGILLFPFTSLLLFCYVTCHLNGRTWFFKQLRSCYMNCCCKFDCLSEARLYDLIKRYQEFPLPDTKVVIDTVTHNELMIAIMKTLNKEMPDLFFSFLPSGSLRERFGKILPSTSCLATDFDMMFIPDAIEIGYEDEPGKAFSLVRSENFADGHFWLKLNDNFLTQWSKFCLKRYYKDGGYNFLSSEKLHYYLGEYLETSREIQHACKIFYGENEGDVEMKLRQSGPAMTFEIFTFEGYDTNRVKCCGVTWCKSQKYRKLFEADFTLAIHCTFWPQEALGFFETQRRLNWPDNFILEKIKAVNCHVVPKRSTEALIKLSLEQAPITRYGISPGLEWRYSFSQAEIFLSECLPEEARSSFIALKAVNKRYLCNKRGEKMASYILKTILFYEVEKKASEYWCQDQITVVEEFFLILVKSLTKCLHERMCPHYFISDINLLANHSIEDCERKAACCESILQSPNKFVGDNWLEYTRCLRYKCCYFGGPAHKKVHEIMQDGEKIIVPKACCALKCNYQPTSLCCCGPCDYDNIDFDVY